ncbi:DeoR/GlpR family DNA-binding transcription regulator [Pandoraea sp.]|uniref:DeoR/GlpR family DNA-binding transcription regulator n=1 Tax=Pandoraea sp. TaxID=1883445 RepID=UPI001214D850|nr:DeoR/GlpR family DNA-binding transcription regulator [Pandoraea sp.]MBU6494298.1 DeoR/GlpR family DNA-binding transcription regulator [Burkholderiales bacterium]MDE2287807.1 DeoR/GlpR transcriptional regulator [Burkholderiales bacterium]MDE2611093.1 DeoR/GlpR transcriptional regulator [Burkholderiales bacterium]TAL54201.1 MAG: DeoR/GlpR transcriptional regulator [Pandoraea sp.]TAM15844.1 MAG: DeoR/GlpR transcriptional regulator [Pandoraea sp.]
MLAEQRQQYVLEQLAKSGALAISDVVRELGVSRETVRRDFNTLAARGLLLMTHGGALATERAEPDSTLRETVNATGKRAIGVRAAELVPDGASLIIDSGTTTRALAQALLEKHRLTVYTNDWQIARMLGRQHENRVILLGGELQDNEDAVQGWDAVNQLAQYHADFSFVGAGAITAEAELTDYSRAAAELRARMLLSANMAVVVADATKFGRTTPVQIRHFEAARYVISDAAPAKPIQQKLRQRGPELLIA